jgi:hypothetical protein
LSLHAGAYRKDDATPKLPGSLVDVASAPQNAAAALVSTTKI